MQYIFSLVFCYLLLFPIDVYTKREVAKFLIFNALNEMTSHIFLVVDKFRGIHVKTLWNTTCVFFFFFFSLPSIRFTASAFRKLPSMYVFSYFPFGFEGRIWDLIVSVPDHCLSFYFQ